MKPHNYAGVAAAAFTAYAFVFGIVMSEPLYVCVIIATFIITPMFAVYTRNIALLALYVVWAVIMLNGSPSEMREVEALRVFFIYGFCAVVFYLVEKRLFVQENADRCWRIVLTPRFTVRSKMLTVGGVVMILFAIATAWARWTENRTAQAKESACREHMKSVVHGIRSHHSSREGFTPGTFPNPDLAPDDRFSWCAVIANNDHDLYLEMDKAWHGTHRARSFAQSGFSTFRCPESGDIPPGSPAATTDIGIGGIGQDAPLLPNSDPRAGVFGYDRHTTLSDIKDGAANTMLIAETGLVSGSWIQGGYATVRGLDPARRPYIGRGRQFGGLHRRGVYAGMANGSVRWVSESINPRVFEAIATMAGGEALPRAW